MSYSLDSENACPSCGAYLSIKFALGGQSAGHYYIRCHDCRFFHAFPRRIDPPTVAHVCPPLGLNVPTSNSSPIMAQPSQPKKRASNGLHCVANGCGRKASPACAHTRCKTHCIIDKAGCLAVGHQAERLTSRQQAKQKHITRRLSAPQAVSTSRSSPAPRRPLPPLSPRTNSIIQNDILPLFALPITPAAEPQLLEEYLRRDAAREEARDQAQDVQLRRIMDNNLWEFPGQSDDNPPYYPPLSAEQQSNLDVMLDASRHTAPSATPSSSSLPPTKLRPVYPPGKAPTTTSSSSLRNPKMTTQMSSSWMRQYNDNTASNATVSKRSTHTTTPAGLLQKRNQFHLVYWGSTGSSPIVKLIQNIPHWPVWTITDSTGLQERLGIDSAFLELYNMAKLKLWVEIGIDCQHKVTQDCYLFLRRSGVVCSDFDKILASSISKAPHLRNNLPHERQVVRNQLRQLRRSPLKTQRKRRRAEVTDSEDEVEVVAENMVIDVDTKDDDERLFPTALLPALPRSVRPRLHSPSPTPASVTRPQLNITIPPSSVSNSSTPTTATSSISSVFDSCEPASSNGSRASTPATPLEPPKLDLKRWPAGLYVKEVVAGFRSMTHPELQHLEVPERFQHIFKRLYVRNTFGDAQRRWRLASQEQRDEGIKAGFTKQGLWSNWQKQVPLRS
ncbi:hypothetical protein B0H15DRAFT_948601 [Mycena belliarum]|uniref:Uncharacterized protein n=1 Tax=Mycena belliarum TaxID=1033014 RepID=A0AAD6U4X6_9AGAR|nr:hypothetical protein B0H15DRAFT_948601 [Mycena belliae]